jgi:copper(I)-binding protein
MNAKPLFTALVLSIAGATCASAHAAPATACLTLESGWVRLPPAPRPMLAGFGRLRNRCEDVKVVVGASSPSFGSVSIHRTELVDGVSRMRELDALPLGRGQEAILQPGGLHLMLMAPARSFAEGEQVVVELQLEGGGKVPLTLTVRPSAPEGSEAGSASHAH